MKDQLDSLIKNALKHMQKAISEFELDQQFAIINFFIFIELTLKARLFSEHWTLIVADVNKISKGKIREGEFISVSLEDANSRLVNILEDGFNKNDFKIFEDIGKERNKIVHFHSTKNKERTASLFCKGWLILNKKITGNWKDSFSESLEDFNTIDSRIHTIQEFLSEKYNKLKLKIDGERKGGAIYFVCFSCKHHSMKKENVMGVLYTVSCMVCTIQLKCLFFPCPYCAGDVFVGTQFDGQCLKCSMMVDKHIFFSHIKGYSELQVAYCGECLYVGHKTVIPLYEKFLCLNCFDIVDNLNPCEFCSERWTNIGEDSYVLGCEFCDGACAWQR